MVPPVDTDEGSETAGAARRKFLIGMGSAGALALAGCASDSPDGGDGGDGNGTDGGDGNDTDGSGGGGDGSGGGEPVDAEFTTESWVLPTDAQFNPYNPKQYSGHAANLLFEPWAAYIPAEGSFAPHLLTDWSVEGTSGSLSIHEEAVWHDGSPVTSRDLVTQLKLDKFIDRAVWESLKSVSQDGEKTVAFELQQEVNPQILNHQLLARRGSVPHATFEKHLQALQDASSDSETDKAKQGLLGEKITDPMGNGPFTLETVNTQKYEFERFDDHRFADAINYPRFGMKHLTSNQERWSALKSDNIDGGGAFTPPNVLKTFPKHVDMVGGPSFWGMGLAFNHDHPVWGKRKVRQAIAHVINRASVAASSGGDLKIPVDTVCGLWTQSDQNVYPAQADQYLGDSKSAFNAYEPSTEKATKLLEEAGLQKKGGTWKRPDGKTLTAPVKAPAGWSDWISGAQSLVGELKKFGLKANLTTVESSTFPSQIADSDFDLATWYWADGVPYPYFTFRQQVASQEAHEYYNYPTEVTVPAVADPSGESITVNVDERVTQLGQATDEAEAEEIIRELAWVVNQDLPILSIQQKMGQWFVTGDDWQYPDVSKPRWKGGAYFMIQRGKVTAKTE
jgi:peptide/nickel transport system substrate-binding protein